MPRHQTLARHLVLAAALCAAASPGMAQDTYIVQPGDTLGAIARDTLGRPSDWRVLCRLNAEVIGENCDRIEVGTVLRLSEDAPVALTTDLEAGTITLTSEAEAEAEAPEPDEGSPTTETAEAEADTAPETPPAERFTLGSGSDAQLQTETAGLDLSMVEGAIVLSGHVENLPSGGRPGIFVRLPDRFEAIASGKTVTVTATLSASAPGPVALAYSTADVGNSRWQTFDVGTEPTEVSFTYDVPQLQRGAGDFIGIDPDPQNTGQSVRLLALSAELPG